MQLQVTLVTSIGQLSLSRYLTCVISKPMLLKLMKYFA